MAEDATGRRTRGVQEHLTVTIPYKQPERTHQRADEITSMFQNASDVLAL
jgi:hypothetical protein